MSKSKHPIAGEYFGPVLPISNQDAGNQDIDNTNKWTYQYYEYTSNEYYCEIKVITYISEGTLNIITA